MFTNIKECKAISVQTSNLFAGIDLGRSDDYTVLTIVDSNNIEVYSERWRHMEWSAIINNIVEQLNKYRPNTLVESNGAQDAIFEQIRNKVAIIKIAYSHLLPHPKASKI